MKFPRGDPGVVEQVFDELCLRADASLDRIERLALQVLIQPAKREHARPSENRRHRGAQLVGYGGDEFVFAANGIAKGFRAGAQVVFTLSQTDEIRHVLDAMNDVRQPAIREDRRIHRAPIPFLELPALGRRPPDVVFLHRHRVRLPRAQDRVERGAQIPCAGRLGITGVVGKHLEQTSADDGLALRSWLRRDRRR